MISPGGVNLDITPTLAVISGPLSIETYDALKERLRYRPKGYAFEPAFKFHKWDGWQPLYVVSPDGRIYFPSGLVHRVWPLVRGDALLPVFEKLPAALPTLDRLYDNAMEVLWLRPEQIEAIRVAVADQRGLMDLAPNFGKTEVMAGILACFPGSRGLVLLDSARLVQQDALRLVERLREPVEVLGDGIRDTGLPPGPSLGQKPRVVVATIQSVHRKIDRPAIQAWLRSFQIVLVDEAHKITGPKLKQTGQWFPVLAHLTSALVRIGLSGSISDMETVIPAEAYLGPTLMQVTDRELIDQGRSADPIILMPYIGSWAHQQDYGDAYEDGIVRNIKRTEMISKDWLVWCAERGLKTLVLVYRKPHGKMLARIATEQGLSAVSIDGDTPPEEIERALEWSRTGAVHVLVASTIGNVGWDMPWLDVLVNAAAWKSPTATKQKLGRVLRVNLERPNWRPIVIDPFDLGSDVLKRHATKRFNTYRKKKFTVNQGSPEEMRALIEQVLHE